MRPMRFGTSKWVFLFAAASAVCGVAAGCSQADVVDSDCATVGQREACQHSTGCAAVQECTKDGWSGCACDAPEDVGVGGAGGAASCESFEVTTPIQVSETSENGRQTFSYAANTGLDAYFQLELYGGADLPKLVPGTYALGEGTEADYATCTRCALLVSPDTGRTFFAREGTLVLETVIPGGSRGTLTNAQFVEVAIDEKTRRSTLVEGGACLTLSTMSFDTSPPTAWQCSGPQYVDERCHCGCGVLDPACTSKTAACDVDTCQTDQTPDPADNTQCIAQ